jgi:hypothetical protein
MNIVKVENKFILTRKKKEEKRNRKKDVVLSLVTGRSSGVCYIFESSY